LIYFSATNCLHFDAEDIQTLIIKAMDISKIIHFSTMELETTKLIPGDNLLCMVDTFYDLIQEEEDSLRYPGFSAEFLNKITLVGDLNLTFIYAPDTDKLFEFSAFIFDAFGLNQLECKNAILTNPNQFMRFTQENGKLEYRIIPPIVDNGEPLDLDILGINQY
ncbi:MAG: hypothetical protein WCM93_03865, partial [Bacteroidota bacterium]